MIRTDGFRRVFHEVQHRLHEAIAIARDRRQGGIEIRPEYDVLGETGLREAQSRGPAPRGCSHEKAAAVGHRKNTSKRSTRRTMRSTSERISWESGRSASGSEPSSSCAAPRMPESGFLISWASMEAIAPSDRAHRIAMREMPVHLVHDARGCNQHTMSPEPSPRGAA